MTGKRSLSKEREKAKRDGKRSGTADLERGDLERTVVRLVRQLDERTSELRRAEIELERLRSTPLRRLSQYARRLVSGSPSPTRLAELSREAVMVWQTGGSSEVLRRTVGKVRDVASRGDRDEVVRLHCDEPHLRHRDIVYGIVTIRGWALSRRAIKSVELHVDDELVGDGRYGEMRPDVAVEHPEYDDADRSGFRIAWDSRTVRDGSHIVRLCATDEAGDFKELSGQVVVDNTTERKEPYDLWIETHERKDVEHSKVAAVRLTTRPLISILMPVYNTDRRYLERAIGSVRTQHYDNWELCICDDGSSKKHVRQTLTAARDNDARIKVTFSEKNRGISAASNAALELATGKLVSLLDHDDELPPHALYFVVEALNRFPNADVVYSDEDKMDKRGRRYDPFFKPDWSPDLLLSCNYLAHFTTIRAQLVRDVGAFRSEYDGSQDYDLYLRAIERARKVHHVPKVLYHWRAVPASTASDPRAKESAHEAARRAIQSHLDRTRVDATVEKAGQLGRWRVKYRLSDKPGVSIVMPTGGKIDLLEKCLEGIRDNTDYPNYEIVLVDNSKGDAVKKTFGRFEKELRGARYIDFRNRAFNYSLINNFAVQASSGPLLLLLNDDIVPISEDWLAAMVEHAVRPEVGAVGAKLLYPDESIQHAGVLLGPFANTGHAFKYLSGDESDPVYFDLPHVTRDCSAVTAACLMIRKEVFEEVGGFDEIHLAVAFQDVDLCLELRQRGYRIVYTPHARLYHFESKTKAEKIPNAYEVRYMQQKWASVIAHDPYYNPNLTRAREDYSLAVLDPV